MENSLYVHSELEDIRELKDRVRSNQDNLLDYNVSDPLRKELLIRTTQIMEELEALENSFKKELSFEL